MKVTITGRKVLITDNFSQRTEKKLAKLDKFFDTDALAEVTVSQERNLHRVEITIRNGGLIFRAEDAAVDPNEVVDNLIDVLFRQIRRNKTRLEKKLRKDAFNDMNLLQANEPEQDYLVVRSKKFSVKPMDVEEAILQMILLEHKFFMFRNIDTNEINVVYCRKDGNYGLLEPNA
jgi:putative sigma-54 modulation protein